MAKLRRRKGVLEPQNRREIRQNPQTETGFFPIYRNRTYMEAHFKLTSAILVIISDNIVR